MQSRLISIGLAASLIAASALPCLAEPARAMGKGHHKWLSTDASVARMARRYRNDAEDHYGQRSYSISVGNPAFPDRFAYWPNRWGD
jgi:hypothetical protein